MYMKQRYPELHCWLMTSITFWQLSYAGKIPCALDSSPSVFESSEFSVQCQYWKDRFGMTQEAVLACKLLLA